VSLPLAQAGIKMMYLSTFHTANVLVEAEMIDKAQHLLLGGYFAVFE